MNRVKFDLTSRLGIAAAAGDRHLAEFVPPNWYLNNASDWKFGLTPADRVKLRPVEPVTVPPRAKVATRPKTTLDRQGRPTEQ